MNGYWEGVSPVRPYRQPCQSLMGEWHGDGAQSKEPVPTVERYLHNGGLNTGANRYSTLFEGRWGVAG